MTFSKRLTADDAEMRRVSRVLCIFLVLVVLLLPDLSTATAISQSGDGRRAIRGP